MVDYSRHVNLNWANILLAGHSQGAGEAAFIAMTAPAVKRVVLLSGPQDKYAATNSAHQALGDKSADWILAASTTPMSRFWGLRNDALNRPLYGNSSNSEGDYGNFVHFNWMNMGGPSAGGVGDNNVGDTDVGDGTSSPGTSHRLTLSDPVGASSYARHISTGTDLGIKNTPSQTPQYPVTSAWTTMLGSP